jgi:predicted ATPase
VTLVGPAGVGKTRLSAAVASEATVPAYFVDLTRATDGNKVEVVAAEALGADPALPPRTGIETVLGNGPTIVLLDNCEHVLEGSAVLVEHILDHCQGTSVLATSRAPLRLPGEHLVTIEPLATTVDGPAMQLFIQRAQDLGREVATTSDEVDDIRRLAELLDGVPLAVELAVARLTAFSVSEILDMLERDLAGLTDERRRGTERHRNVRAAIQWSMLLLDEETRRLLCRLAVLPGTFRLRTAMAAIGSDRDGRALASAMPTLIEQSLVTVEHRTGSTRYRMLEMIRAVGQDSLPSEERETVLDALLVHLTHELEQQDERDVPEPGNEAEIQLDGPLYSIAAEHALATGQIELGLRFVYSLFLVWHAQTQRATLDRWMTDLVSRVDGPSRWRGMVLRRQAIIANEDFADDERSMRLFDAAEADALAIADRQLLSMVRVTRLGFDQTYGRLDGVEDGLQEAIAVLEEFEGEFLSNALTSLGELYFFRAQFDSAEKVFERAARGSPVWYRRVVLEEELAWCALLSGRIELAATRAVQSLEMAERSGDPTLLAHAINVAANAALASGDTSSASQLFRRAVSVACEHELSQLPWPWPV